MCGICFCLHKESTSVSIDYTPLNHRGPDFQNQYGPILISSNFYLTFAVSVLALRGFKQAQPFVDDNGNLLLYNGEIYEGSFEIKPDDNDGALLFEQLRKCTNDTDICNLISSLEGCFAFIYFQKQTKSLYYGRDRLGRRSLMSTNLPQSQSNIQMIVSSVRLNQLAYTELESNVLYKLTVNDSNQTYQIDTISYVKSLINEIPFEPPDILLNEFESNSIFQDLSQTFLNQLQSAVQKRILNLPSLCRQCKRLIDDNLRPKNGCEHAKLAILFSGGIDSSVLAVLVDRILPRNEPVDLLNVAFFSDVLTPPADRQTGLQALTEFNSNRQWNFVKIDIDLNELRYYRENIIKNVIYPCSTVLDDSIGSALWFAARGNGILHSTDLPYESPAEVLLSGLGADEQLAGYSRHRTTYRLGGWQALIEELQMEMNRISKRNLGRDDRVISSLGKEVRFPYLDEQLVHYLQSIPVWYKADLRLARGIGEKYLLRYVACHYLSLEKCSKYPKRAIQFGSRIAKLESKKEKASDQCSRLTTKERTEFDDED